uniref:Uncharacterized protein n=1 Tax=Anguilla anguilla TaxID=7936 RepID=A0A0E9R9L7_ANGAN
MAPWSNIAGQPVLSNELGLFFCMLYGFVTYFCFHYFHGHAYLTRQANTPSANLSL